MLQICNALIQRVKREYEKLPNIQFKRELMKTREKNHSCQKILHAVSFLKLAAILYTGTKKIKLRKLPQTVHQGINHGRFRIFITLDRNRHTPILDIFIGRRLIWISFNMWHVIVI